MKARVLLMGLLTVGIVAIPVTTQAATITGTRQKIQAARCTVAETRIGNLLTAMKAVGAKRTLVYQNLKTDVQNGVDKATAAGYDTTKLKADLDDLDTAIKNYRGTTTTLYTDIQNTQNFACGDSDGQFLDALQTARQQLTTVDTAAKNVKSIYQGQVKTDLQDLRAWLKTQTPSSDSQTQTQTQSQSQPDQSSTNTTTPASGPPTTSQN